MYVFLPPSMHCHTYDLIFYPPYFLSLIHLPSRYGKTLFRKLEKKSNSIIGPKSNLSLTHCLMLFYVLLLSPPYLPISPVSLTT